MTTPTTSAAPSGTSGRSCWARPTTRGELRDRIARGETCEVAGHVAEMTAIMLRGWLQFDGFTMRPSANDGWSLFEPNSLLDRSHPSNSGA
jgi:hypothetical protein